MQWVKCGRSNCRCATGQGHIAHYQFWREGGRLCKQYVRAADLAAVRSAYEARRQDRQELAAAWEQWRQLVTIAREVTA